MKKQKVLFIGNGINLINNETSWQSLLNYLIARFGNLQYNDNIFDIPFPLLYEIIINISARKGKTEEEVKRYVAKKVSNFETNEYHEKLGDIGFTDIITTNYDYTLEKALTKNVPDSKDFSTVVETKYSIFRKIKINNTYFWHIHGESNNLKSINLGYEQYSGYLQKMRNYLLTGTDYAGFPKEPAKARYNKKSFKINSWIDLFFKRDIYILGFSFDYCEMHLWWLITIRARKNLQNLVKNKIFYLYPKVEGRYDADCNKKHNNLKSRLEVFKNLGVEVKGFVIKKEDWEKNDYTSYYSEALDFIKDR